MVKARDKLGRFLPYTDLKKHLGLYTKKTNGCWLWTGAVSHGGYGQLNHARQHLKAHRVAYLLYRGPIPAGLHVCHACDEPRCLRPDHLFADTALDNSRDAVAKGRSARGERNPHAKLAHGDVTVIRQRMQAIRRGKHALALQIAGEYGVSQKHILRLGRGESWAHVNAEMEAHL